MGRNILTTIAVLLLTLTLYGQDGPKVGLVLSGGGAKGLAHIGVIKVLEEVGIVPDYITGTSMGSVVGGLYSVGYTADELEIIARTSDWDKLLGNRTAFENIAIEQKEYYDNYQLNLPVDGFNVGLPKGVIEGQELSDLLIGLTAPVHDVHDFDSLPRPFRCIGADITNGDKIVLKDGFLATAIRASMAIPSIFTPVEIDGRLLVDGGLVHNFPVQEVIDMGADIVIGVSVSDSLVEVDELNSLVDILTQATFIASVKVTREQGKLVDILIRPPMSPYTSGSFGAADSILIRGERTARQAYPALKHLADSLKQLREFHPIVKPPLPDKFKVSGISVDGNEVISERLIKGKFGIEPGDSVTQHDIKRGTDALFGTINFDLVAYERLPGLGGDSIALDVNESTPGRLSFDLHYDTENGVGLLGTFQYRNLGIQNSRLTFLADIAPTPYINLDYFVYVGKNQRGAFSFGLKYFNDEVGLFVDDGTTEAIYANRLWHYYINFQTTQHQKRAFGVRIFSESNRIKPEVTVSNIKLFDKLVYNNFGVKPYLIWNTIDQRAIPNSGLTLNVSTTLNLRMNVEVEEPNPGLMEFDQDYVMFSLDVNYRHYFPITEKFNIEMSHTLRLTNLESPNLNISDFNFVGGYKPNFINSEPFWGSKKYQFELTSFYRAALRLRYRLIKNLHLEAGANYLDVEHPASWFGDNITYIQAGERDRRFGFMFGGTFNSFAGPIRLYFSKDVNNSTWHPWLSVGYNFKNSPMP